MLKIFGVLIIFVSTHIIARGPFVSLLHVHLALGELSQGVRVSLRSV
jgi:hypothetical protein